MALELKDIENVADELKGRVEEFKKKNNDRLDGIEQERSKLADQVHNLSNNVTDLQKHKDDLERQLKSIEEAGARPGATAGGVHQEHKEAFLRFMRKGDESNIRELQKKALSIDVDDSGGFAVPEELDRDISSSLRDETPMRRLCRVITVGNEEYRKLYNNGGTTSGWVGETEARPETGTPTIASLAPVFGELYANPGATQKSLDDVFFNAEQWLGEEVLTEFSERENAAFTNGDGANMPLGIMRAPTAAAPDATRDGRTFRHVLTEAAGVISPDDIKRFPQKVKAGYRRAGSWMMTGQTLEQIMVMKDANGQYLWRAGFEENTTMNLIGRPVEENEDMPEVAAGSNSIAFGDFRRAYYILDRLGSTTLRDPYTNKPFVHFYTVKRVGGMTVDTRAVSFMQIRA